MKKSILILFSFSLFFLSCKKDDDSTPSNNNGSNNNQTNAVPSVVNDNATTNRVTDVTINVLSNDFDSDGDALTVVSNATPSSGSVVDNSDGTFTFTPDGTTVGTVTFDYTVSDGTDEATGTVTIEVTKTSAETTTENLIAANTITRIHKAYGQSTWGGFHLMLFDTVNKTVSVTFDESFTLYHFTMESDGDNSTTYSIDADGNLILPNISYSVGEYSFNGLTGLNLTPLDGETYLHQANTDGDYLTLTENIDYKGETEVLIEQYEFLYIYDYNTGYLTSDFLQFDHLNNSITWWYHEASQTNISGSMLSSASTLNYSINYQGGLILSNDRTFLVEAYSNATGDGIRLTTSSGGGPFILLEQ